MYSCLNWSFQDCGKGEHSIRHMQWIKAAYLMTDKLQREQLSSSNNAQCPCEPISGSIDEGCYSPSNSRNSQMLHLWTLLHCLLHISNEGGGTLDSSDR